MKKRNLSKWMVLATAAGAVALVVVLLPPAADGMPCGTCGPTVHSASGSGRGASCAEAAIAARSNAIQSAASSNPSCIPCSMTQGTTTCAVSSWFGSPPANPFFSTLSITYRCDVCSGGGPSM